MASQCNQLKKQHRPRYRDPQAKRARLRCDPIATALSIQQTEIGGWSELTEGVNDKDKRRQKSPKFQQKVTLRSIEISLSHKQSFLLSLSLSLFLCLSTSAIRSNTPVRVAQDIAGGGVDRHCTGASGLVGLLLDRNRKKDREKSVCEREREKQLISPSFLSLSFSLCLSRDLFIRG